jgi:hypothetical protein
VVRESVKCEGAIRISEIVGRRKRGMEGDGNRWKATKAKTRER